MADEPRIEAAAEATEARPEPMAGAMEVRRVELDVPAELYRRAMAMAAEEDWPEREALLTVLSHGTAFLEGEREVSELNRGDPDLRAEVERFRRMAMGLQGAYSVMKFRAYELGEQVKTLEMNVSGLRAENRIALFRLGMFREDENRLRSELAALRAENAELRARLEAAEAGREVRPAPAPRPDGRAAAQRLRQAWRRFREGG